MKNAIKITLVVLGAITAVIFLTHLEDIYSPLIYVLAIPFLLFYGGGLIFLIWFYGRRAIKAMIREGRVSFSLDWDSEEDIIMTLGDERNIKGKRLSGRILRGDKELGKTTVLIEKWEPEK